MGNRMTLAKLQMMREQGDHQHRAGDVGERYNRSEHGGGYERNDGGMHPGGGYRTDMGYYPPHRYPEMTYDNQDPHTGRRRRNESTYGRHDDGMYDRRMGFGTEEGDDIGMRRRNDGGRMHYGDEHEGAQPVRFGGVISMEDGRKHHQRMTREMAEEWTQGMQGSDPAKPHGAKWSPEQVKPIATKYGIPTEGDRFWEFYAVMNAMYSDYYAVAKKYNTLTPDYFADLAMAFISDKDAVENKTVMYYMRTSHAHRPSQDRYQK